MEIHVAVQILPPPKPGTAIVPLPAAWQCSSVSVANYRWSTFADVVMILQIFANFENKTSAFIDAP